MGILFNKKQKRPWWLRRKGVEHQKPIVNAEDYYKQSVMIHIERNSELFSRIEALAEKTGKPVEGVFSWAVLLGVEKHMKESVCVLEQLHEKSE